MLLYYYLGGGVSVVGVENPFLAVLKILQNNKKATLEDYSKRIKLI